MSFGSILSLSWRYICWSMLGPFWAILGHFGPIVPILWQCWTYVGPIFGSLADLTTFSKTLKKYDSRANMPPTQAKAYSNSYCNCFSLMRARKKTPRHLQCGPIFPWAEVLLFFFVSIYLHVFEDGVISREESLGLQALSCPSFRPCSLLHSLLVPRFAAAMTGTAAAPGIEAA